MPSSSSSKTGSSSTSGVVVPSSNINNIGIKVPVAYDVSVP